MPKGFCVHDGVTRLVMACPCSVFSSAAEQRQHDGENKADSVSCICPCFAGSARVFLLPIHWFLKHLIS